MRIQGASGLKDIVVISIFSVKRPARSSAESEKGITGRGGSG